MDVNRAEEPFILRCLKYVLTLPYPELEHEADKKFESLEGWEHMESEATNIAPKGVISYLQRVASEKNLQAREDILAMANMFKNCTLANFTTDQTNIEALFKNNTPEVMEMANNPYISTQSTLEL